MIVSVLILTLSVAMFFFYFQVTCQKILRQQFDREYFRSVVKANGLEFLALRESLAQFGAPADYPRLREMLRCDFLALTYLLKNVGNVKARYSSKERLLILYFHSMFLSLAARRLLKFGEKRAILRMTSVLQYFSNVVGQRMDTVGFGNVAAADYLPNL